jgi:hypothetical protein
MTKPSSNNLKFKEIGLKYHPDFDYFKIAWVYDIPHRIGTGISVKLPFHQIREL